MADAALLEDSEAETEVIGEVEMEQDAMVDAALLEGSGTESASLSPEIRGRISLAEWGKIWKGEQNPGC